MTTRAWASDDERGKPTELRTLIHEVFQLGGFFS
jgi:hypothetical protein